jgi:hypothetical protein
MRALADPHGRQTFFPTPFSTIVQSLRGHRVDLAPSIWPESCCDEVGLDRQYAQLINRAVVAWPDQTVVNFLPRRQRNSSSAHHGVEFIGGHLHFPLDAGVNDYVIIIAASVTASHRLGLLSRRRATADIIGHAPPLIIVGRWPREARWHADGTKLRTAAAFRCQDNRATDNVGNIVMPTGAMIDGIATGA